MEVQQVITMLLSVLGTFIAKLSQLNLEPNPNPQFVSVLIKDLLKSLEEALHQLDPQFLSTDTNKDSCLHASRIPITINKDQQNFDHPSSSTGGHNMAQHSLSNSNPSNAVGEIRFPVNSHHVQTDTQSDKGKGFGHEFWFHGNASCSESDMSSHTYTFNHGSCSASMPDCDDTMGYDSETFGHLLWSIDGEDPLSLQDFSQSFFRKSDNLHRQVENFDNMQQFPSSTEQATTTCPKSPANSTKSNLALTSNVNAPTATTTTTTTHDNASSALLEWSLKSNHLRSDALPILKEDLENVLYPRLSDHDRKKLLKFGVLTFEYEVDSTHCYAGYIERQPQGKGKIHLTRLRNFYRKVKAERQDRLALFMSSSDPLFLKLRFDKVPKQKKKSHDSIPSFNSEFPDSTWCIGS